MPDMEPHMRTALVDQVTRADDLRRRADGRRLTARPGSQAGADHAIPHARHVSILAGISVWVAVDHLTAWQCVVASGCIPIHAPMTLLRAALESAVMARWLVDDRVPSLLRVGRGIAGQVKDYTERRRFEIAINAPPPPVGGSRSAAERLAEIEVERDRDGLPVVYVPSYTDLTRDYGAPGHEDFQWMYRLMSAFAHGHPWALNGTNLETVAETGPGTILGRITSSERIVLRATNIVTDHVDVALTEVERYMGVPQD